MFRLYSKFRRINSNIRWYFRQVPYIVKANNINCFLDVPAKDHQVNVFDYHPDKLGYDLCQGTPYNLGDSLGEVIVDFLLS